jgi:GDPmannose 4,6-dehydratase
MNKKKVLITGVTGQDGAILADYLFKNNYDVYGASRRTSHNLWRINELDLLNKISYLSYDATDSATIDYIVSSNRFDFIYHFAGTSFTVDSLEFPQNTLVTNINGTVSLLEAVRKFSPESKIFIASSSEVFSRSSGSHSFNLNEESLRGPVNPYGVSHLAVDAIVNIYRNTHNLNIGLGIFFNHESEFRGLQFVTRKISNGIAEIKSGRKVPIRLGNFSAIRDWSCAHEFMFGVSLLMNKSKFNDYVFASGKSTSVRELLTISASVAGFDPKFEGSGLNEVCFDLKTGTKLALSDQKFYRNVDPNLYVGDTTKLTTETGWNPTRNFTEVIEKMTKVDILRVLK